MTERYEQSAPSGLNVLRSSRPYEAFVAVARVIYQDALRPSSLFDTNDVAPSTSVHPTAQLASGVTVDLGAVIGPEAAIGTGTLIGVNAVIGSRVRIGQSCTIGAGSSITQRISAIER